MQPKKRFLKFWKLVQRENAVRFILISLLSFVATVTFVRSFLAFTGYPQLGNGTLHIAHVLWGGLILYIAAILPLIYLNPRILNVVAILSGVGVGLFIDEVGKFITRQYDYFYPAAAPIIYVFFLLIVILIIMINRPEQIDGRSELVQALETVREELYRPLEPHERRHFERDIRKVIETDLNPLHITLAMQLLEFIQSDDRSVPETTPTWWRSLVVRVKAWLTEPRLRWLLVAGMVYLSFLTLKNPILLLLVKSIPQSSVIAFLNVHFGGQIEAIASPVLSNLRLWLEVMVGIVLLVCAVLLALGEREKGITLGFLVLLLALAGLDMLLFYFEQFSAVLMVGFQFIMLFGVLYYRRNYLKIPNEELDIQA